jgi:hypothetical protein
VALYAALSEPGEGPLQTLTRIGGAIQGFLVEGFARARQVVGSFAQGFGDTFAGFDVALSRLRFAFGPIVDKVAELLGFLAGQDAAGALSLWNMIGQAVGFIGNILVNQVVAGFELLATVIDVVISTFRPFQLAIAQILQGLIGLVTGSMSAGDAIGLMVQGIGGALVALVNAAFQLLAGTVEAVLRLLTMQLAGIPGMEGFLASTGSLGADAIGQARAAFERETSNAIAGIDLAEARRTRAQGQASAPSITVTPAAVENTVKVENVVKLDGRDVARSQGAAAVRSGQRQGEAINPDARGRIIRGGVIRNLAPSEVL